MGLSLRGQTSGAVDINAPAVAGDNTITLPDGNGSANQFYKNSTTAGIVTHSSMVEDSSGNVGINTITFPANGTNLKVSDGTISRLGLDKTGANARSFTIGNSGTLLNVYDETADAERLRITSTGGFGINATTIPAGVNVAVGGTIRVQDTANAAQYLTINHQGINFQNTGAGSSTVASAHTLDDYEEGTWTVTCANGVTVYAANDQMSYTKIGRQVTVTGQFRVNSGNSNSNLYITSLPFVAASNTENEFLSVGAVRVYLGAIRGTAVQVICVGADGTDDLYINEVRDNATDEPVTATNDAFYMISYTYFTA